MTTSDDFMAGPQVRAYCNDKAPSRVQFQGFINEQQEYSDGGNRAHLDQHFFFPQTESFHRLAKQKPQGALVVFYAKGKRSHQNHGREKRNRGEPNKKADRFLADYHSFDVLKERNEACSDQGKTERQHQRAKLLYDSSLHVEIRCVPGLGRRSL